MNACCETFRATSWDEAYSQAQQFLDEHLHKTGSAATVLSIAHAAEPPYAVDFVWYIA